MIRAKERVRHAFTFRCPYCKKDTDYLTCCPSCAKRLLEFVNNNYGKTAFCDQFDSAFIYEDLVRDAIMAFKFHGHTEYVRSFISVIKNCVHGSSYDFVISVPHFKQDKKEYDTSELLAKHLSDSLKIPYEKRAVTKICKTQRQHDLEFDDRFFNIIGCFKANEKKVAGKTILICDDIITSGSTINELAKACKSAGAVRVDAVSLAAAASAFVVDTERYL